MNGHLRDVTIKALFRGKHFPRAARKTHKDIVTSWTEACSDLGEATHERTLTTPDIRFANTLGLGVRKCIIPATDTSPERTEHRLMVPPYLMRNSGFDGVGGSRLYVAARSVAEVTFGDNARWWNSGAPPDEVIEFEASNGRLVCCESWIYRVVARQWLQVVGPRAEQVQHPNSHAFRPKRGRATAFAQYQKAFSTHRFVVTKDISNFYGSIPLGLADFVTSRLLPQLSPELRHFGLWFQTAPIWRKPSHPARLAGDPRIRVEAPGHLLPGTTTAPLLSNLVADYVLGWPFEFQNTGAVVLIRYADDLLVMGTTPSAAMTGVERIERLLARVGMSLNPDKGLRSPVDIERTPTLWLGKFLHGRSTRTPDGTVERYIGELLALAPGSVEFRRKVHSVRNELAFDAGDRMSFVARRVKRRSRCHFDALLQIGARAPDEGAEVAQ